jgi:hypothetical protein
VESNPAQGMDVCPYFSVLCCPVKVEALLRADYSSNGVLPNSTGLPIRLTRHVRRGLGAQGVRGTALAKKKKQINKQVKFEIIFGV